MVAFLTVGIPYYSSAINVTPTEKEIKKALTRGKNSAKSQIPPSKLFWHFGESGDFKPHGLLMTKLSGLAVLSAHYSFRSAVPSQEDISRILNERHLQVSITIYGSSPSFAVDSYILLQQEKAIISPEKVRSDARASRSHAWPNDPPYQAKVVASFAYGSFDPMLPTIATVFPGGGGETSFTLDFSKIP